MIVKLSDPTNTEMIVAEAYQRTLQDSASYYCNRLQAFRKAYGNISLPDVYSSICMQYDNDTPQTNYGRHVEGDYVTIRSNHVKGYSLPVTCRFNDEGEISISCSRSQHTEHSHTLLEVFCKNLLHISNEQNIEVEIISRN
jgi:hypothetical protein